MSHLCIKPACGPNCSMCNHAISAETARAYAIRYAVPQKPATDAPPANSLIRLIASAYGVDDEIACQWLCVRQDDFEAWIPPLGAVA